MGFLLIFLFVQTGLVSLLILVAMGIVTTVALFAEECERLLTGARFALRIHRERYTHYRWLH